MKPITHFKLAAFGSVEYYMWHSICHITAYNLREDVWEYYLSGTMVRLRSTFGRRNTYHVLNIFLGPDKNTLSPIVLYCIVQSRYPQNYTSQSRTNTTHDISAFSHKKTMHRLSINMYNLSHQLEDMVGTVVDDIPSLEDINATVYEYFAGRDLLIQFPIRSAMYGFTQ